MNIPEDATKRDIEYFNTLTRKEKDYFALKFVADQSRRVRNGTLEKLRKKAG